VLRGELRGGCNFSHLRQCLDFATCRAPLARMTLCARPMQGFKCHWNPLESARCNAREDRNLLACCCSKSQIFVHTFIQVKIRMNTKMILAALALSLSLAACAKKEEAAPAAEAPPAAEAAPAPAPAADAAAPAADAAAPAADAADRLPLLLKHRSSNSAWMYRAATCRPVHRLRCGGAKIEVLIRGRSCSFTLG